MWNVNKGFLIQEQAQKQARLTYGQCYTLENLYQREEGEEEKVPEK